MDRSRLGRLLGDILDELAKSGERPVPVPGILLDLLYSLLEDARRIRVPLVGPAWGPWRAVPLASASRTAAPRSAGTLLPAPAELGVMAPEPVFLLQRGQFSMLVDEVAFELASLLNWCGVPEPTRARAAAGGRHYPMRAMA